MEHTTRARTIAVTYRNRSRFARIRLRYPGRRPSRLTKGYPGHVKLPDYNAELALELIGGTGELPTSKRDLLIVLAHYRHALHVLDRGSRPSTRARAPRSDDRADTAQAKRTDTAVRVAVR